MARYAKVIKILDNVIVADSLKNICLGDKKVGYQFGLRLDYYRGHFLSVIEVFKVRIDGKEIDDQNVKFCINGKEFSPVEFDKCYTEFWHVLEDANIKILEEGGLEPGEHEVEVEMYYRSPYMPIGDNHEYMWISNCGTRTMPVA